jgi:hypothetical protein
MPADVGWAKTPNVAFEKVDALRRKRVLLPSARAAVRILVSPSVAVRLARSTSDQRSSLAAAPAGRGKNLAECANFIKQSQFHGWGSGGMPARGPTRRLPTGAWLHLLKDSLIHLGASSDAIDAILTGASSMVTTQRIAEFASWLEEVDPGFLVSVILAETGEDYQGRDLFDQVARIIEIFGVAGAGKIVGCH